NQLTRLPDVLRQMLELERLYLAGNRLQLTEFTRATLAGLRTLKTLNLSDNPLLDPPDVSRLFDLRELFLRNCRLTELPVGVQRLPYLDNVDLRENDIAYLPDWLFRMPRRFTETINLRLNALSAASHLAVRTYRREHGIGMGVIEDDIARLTEQRARELWLADERVGDYQQRSNLWNGLRDEPGADGLFKLLAELGSTADARHVREDLDRRVWRVLERAAADAELREEIFQRAATPLHCDDAAATSFSSLEILVEINDVTRLVEGGQATAQPLLKLAKGLFRLEQLERIARRHSDDNPMADPLEVSLAFRTGLVDRFHLPGQPSHMRFARLGGVTPEALTLAEAQVKVAELSPDLLKYLVGLPFWTDYLKRSFAGRFDAINTPFDQRMNEVFDQGLTLEDADYRDQMHTILDEQRAAEAAELERLSESVMKTEDLGLCEILQA
ncbi:MAG: NEL-type E3 ubiquitin ligase domain-containing protein, partial [Pseudomonas sp.]|uniref:NEL-type E3 ubiquitin ligase domain-containing protein n=1 Tax=Pseudomonas sp. TaxID=306 RepID=UPI003C709352